MHSVQTPLGPQAALCSAVAFFGCAVPAIPLTNFCFRLSTPKFMVNFHTVFNIVFYYLLG